MDEQRILEAERYQMEQIRELEFEELQVEEMDEGNSSDDDRNAVLAFLDGGAILTLPLFYLEGVVLFPGAILPLRVVQHNFISAVERALTQVDAPYTIGVVHAYRDRDRGQLRFATIGTTAEIRQYRRLEDGSLNVVTRGQQRIRIRRHWTDVEGVGRLMPSKVSLHGHGDGDNDSEANSEESFETELSSAEKRIHQSAVSSCCGYDKMDESTSSSDDKIDSEIKYSRSHIIDSGCSSTPGEKSHKGEGSRRRSKNAGLNKFRRVPRAFWPYWVYRMYDSYCLAGRAADMWKQIVGTPSMDGLVKRPDLLSFYIASKIPVSESTRQELLEIDGISHRLQREIDLLKSFDLIRCKHCQIVIARRSDMLVMSSEGPLGAYVNPHGSVHEIMTFYKVNGLALDGEAVTEYSWFPGYAWTIADCANCEFHMGWLFTATKKQLKPQSFWAIRSAQVADDKH
ncbi:hypothetical protein GH714_031348 [Hevea brasiliensis]|uniref:Protein cereblon n=1 Tax=Hevea brasiliensis TaxID=3981 RepID=A0A6A6LTT6_HEVBR|nr:hypothetical protein GH714_031348 [Hevea brasiliensis]